MIHVENPKLIEAANAPDITNWTVHLVLRWPGGEPLSTRQQDTIAHNVVETGDAGVQAMTLEAEPDIPYAYVELDIGTSQAELISDLEGEAVSDSGYEWLRKELALTKSIDSCLGGMACAGIELEDLGLETAFVADEVELHDAYPESANPKVYITSKRHCADDVAFRLFEKEKGSYIELENFLKAA